MPTFEVEDRFWNQCRRPSPEHQEQFTRVRREFVGILQAWERAGRRRAPYFPDSLGVKPMQGHRGIMELAWAPDGRCTWRFGAPQRPGTCHVIWRRIGSHEIYGDP